MNSSIGIPFTLRCFEVTLAYWSISATLRAHYGELVYRAVNMDVGHVSQSLYLAAEGVDCAVCAVGYYDEDVYDRVLEIDGSSEYVAFTAAVGRKPDIILDP